MTKGTLIIYLCAEGEEWIILPPENDDILGRATRVIKESYSWDPDDTTEVGERLTNHATVGDNQCQVIPSEWVVTSVESAEASSLSEFDEIVLAYCERQPLSPEELEEQSYVTDIKQPALV